MHPNVRFIHGPHTWTVNFPQSKILRTPSGPYIKLSYLHACAYAGLGACSQPLNIGSGRDIVACKCRHGGNVPDTVFVSAYAPDTSRGRTARQDFLQRLAEALLEISRTIRKAQAI